MSCDDQAAGDGAAPTGGLSLVALGRFRLRLDKGGFVLARLECDLPVFRMAVGIVPDSQPHVIPASGQRSNDLFRGGRYPGSHRIIDRHALVGVMLSNFANDFAADDGSKPPSLV